MASTLKILIADPDELFLRQFKKHLSSLGYRVEIATGGLSCLQKLESFKPDLLISELMLPEIHGIEILRKIKQDPRSKQLGVILMSAHVMTQNYYTAIKLGCDYFLEKPFVFSKVGPLLTRFFKDRLFPCPFSGKTNLYGKHNHYVPKRHFLNSYLKFWGTRGSNPVSGPEYVRFGGNTSCLEIRHQNDLIIVDAGTGIRPLGLNMEGHKKIDILLGHTHWDHLAGFPFFNPLYDPECHITIWAPVGFEKSVEELFTEMLAYDFFPIRLDDIRATLAFREIQERIPFSIGNIEVNSHYAYHPGSTLLFKFKVAKSSFIYATDNEFLMGYHGHPNKITTKQLSSYKSMIQFFKGSDFVVHEAQYTPQEYQNQVGWGHSSIPNAAILMKQAEINHWVLTHHDPKHTDLILLNKIQMQHDIIDDYRFDCHLRMAFDGMMLPL